ncbi:MAG: hypothetical protein PHN61_09280 [Methanothrix sp.]|nr:hypothetical protein [Methanothrix sp.]
MICATGLAIFLIYDLVSFASNPGYKGVAFDFKGLESGVPSVVNDKEMSGNISPNSSLNTSRQTKEQSPANLSVMNASLLSSQAVKGVVATGKSSSSSSKGSVDKKSGNSPATGHHSSSSSSSSKSSSANSAKKSSDMNNLTNETATAPMLTNQSMNNSQVQESPLSNASSIATTEVLASLPSAAIGSLPNLAENTPAREPVSIIEFKTETKISPKSKQDINPDNGAGTVGTSASDNAKNAKSSKVATKNIKLKTAKKKTASSMKSKSTSSSQAEKVKEARDKMKANKDRIEQNMKKKAAQLRSKAA